MTNFEKFVLRFILLILEIFLGVADGGKPEESERLLNGTKLLHKQIITELSHDNMEKNR